MIELTNGTQLFINRSYSNWHSPFTLETSNLNTCPNGNCSWQDHMQENSVQDPHFTKELLSIPPGTRLLLLDDYCDSWYVSFLTLESIFDPNGSTQFRFQERSRRCYHYQQPPHPSGGFGVHLFLASIRLIATVENSEPAFGKFGKRPLFMRELSRLTGLPMSEVRKGINNIDASIPKQKLILKPWHSQATPIWNDLCQGRLLEVAHRLRGLFNFPKLYYPAAIFFVVAAQRGALSQLKQVIDIGEKPVLIPDNFGATIASTLKMLESSAHGMLEESENWWPEFQEMFGIKRPSIISWA